MPANAGIHAFGCARKQDVDGRDKPDHDGLSGTRPMKLAVPDLISNSYFPAEAAVELGCFRDEGLDVSLELIFPVDRAFAALRDGAVDLVGGSAHSALAAFPEWQGVKLVCAQAQGMYWFLVLHADLGARRGEIEAVKGRSLGAAPWVEMGLRRLLIEAGLDLARDGIKIAPVPGASGASVNFGLTAAKALEERKIDGFWANGMGAEVAVRRGVGTIVLDVRRGDGPKPCFNYTMASIAASDRLLAQEPGLAAAVTRAIDRTHAALKREPALAREVGRKLFPPAEAELIEDLIRRDLPYYDSRISHAAVDGMQRFARALGILTVERPYEAIVASPQLGTGVISG
jgi:ABC-type nitrate/sulfonate/bicarbonate transport system substrate-binding protein